LIIDTDVLIWYLRGDSNAQKAILANIPFKISVINYLELVQGMRNKNELRALQKQLKRWSVKIIQINESISTYASFLVENFYMSHSMETADAIIAATSIEHNETLLTANHKHYGFIPNILIKKFKPGNSK